MSEPDAPHGRILASAFVPHALLRGAHAQTLYPALLRPLPRLALAVERLDTPDGDFIDLGWAGADAPRAPIAVLVHGLGGGFESRYLLGLGARLGAAGWRVCALRLRGAGPEPNRMARAYHHGDTADLRWLWHRLRQAHPRRFIASVGWSLGGNITLKALGEEGDDAPVDVACAVSVPYQLHDCAEHLRRGFARVYQNHLLTALKAMVRRKHAHTPLPAPADVQRALAARDFFEFDDAFTAPLNGYADAADYYARAACGAFLPRIRVPALLLHARDDPFMTPRVVPGAESMSAALTLELSERGGHVGFVSADARGGAVYWAEQRLFDWLEAARRSQADAATISPRAPPASGNAAAVVR